MAKKPRSSFTPPPAGPKAPAGVKRLLKKVYQDCRFRTQAKVIDSPADKKSKRRCAGSAWSAVEGAGWRKRPDGSWFRLASSKKSL